MSATASPQACRLLCAPLCLSLDTRSTTDADLWLMLHQGWGGPDGDAIRRELRAAAALSKLSYFQQLLSWVRCWRLYPKDPRPVSAAACRACIAIVATTDALDDLLDEDRGCPVALLTSLLDRLLRAANQACPHAKSRVEKDPSRPSSYGSRNASRDAAAWAAGPPRLATLRVQANLSCSGGPTTLEPAIRTVKARLPGTVEAAALGPGVPARQAVARLAEIWPRWS